MSQSIFSSVHTPRLIIRPIEMDDADAYYQAELASVQELAPHWSWVKTDKSIDDIREFIFEALEGHKKDRPVDMYFSILSKENNKFLGVIWTSDINWFVPKFEIHYWLDNREIDKGYMTEAVNALSRACFLYHGAKRIEIKISTTNDKSNAIANRLNFKLEAEMENYFINFATNKITNGLLYSCCRIDLLPPLEVNIFEK